jgi:glycoside/pentoside/hexuronide:cation symporter, GPH family
MNSNARINTFGAGQGVRYGFLGFPLAFCALPLYVLLPNLYAREYGVPLLTLGVILLGSRLLDAFIDPFIGRWCDRLYAQSIRAVLTFGALAAVVLGAGFSLLFFPMTSDPQSLIIVTTLLLIATYAAYSALSVMHQSWGAKLGGDESQRSRVVAWREGMGLLGVVLASVTPTLLGLPAMVSLFLGSLGVGWWAWTRAARPDPLTRTAINDSGDPHPVDLWHPWRNPAFRRLMAVFLLNGIASAVPATLILFFVQDRLQAPESMQPLFLGSFFVCGAISMPLWLRMVKRFGLARSWLCGMVLSICVFLWATQLGAGDTRAFAVVCALSGLALGSDLALPSALLAGVIADSGERGRAEGTYFGWWNFATKLNLAMAAGLALPLLSVFGYTPGARDEQALQTLTIAYCLLPCALKAFAAAVLYFFMIHPSPANAANVATVAPSNTHRKTV